MNLSRSLKNASHSQVRSICYNSNKKEYIFGLENGSICLWDARKMILVKQMDNHLGWSHSLLEKVDTKLLIYSLLLVNSVQLLLLGVKDGLVAYFYDPLRNAGTYLPRQSPRRYLHFNSDVKCLAQFNKRVFAAGTCRKIVIYDSSALIRRDLIPIIVIHNAHEAAISAIE
ncbi:hypothetical protein Ciccas_013401, partial [Cichlidogyrus casuarinus]